LGGVRAAAKAAASRRTPKKTRERDGPTRVGGCENGETLPGGESSPVGRAGPAVLLAEPDEQPDDEGRCRKNYRRNGPFAYARGKRERIPQPGGTRVRIGFARRAHQRKFTPRLGINLAVRDCQEKNDDFEEKVKESYRRPAIRDQEEGG
jgi:hypothetical protein